nr:MAG TPA: hypothetical protein [Caudoviricetes sp.]
MYSVSENILRFLRSNGPSSRAAVWAEFGMGQYKETDACIKDLLAEHLLSCQKAQDFRDFHLDTLSVTPAGSGLLEELDKHAAQEEQRQAEQEAAEAKRLQERHDDRSREERYHRSQNRVTILAAVVSSFLSFALGLLVEHHAQIISSLIALFH